MAFFQYRREGEMRATNSVLTLFIKFGKMIKNRSRLSRFKCGDCEISEHCGQLPSDDCIPRTAQIERDGDRSRSQSPRGYQASY
jgi:hypothetical protein